jgi:hypothetical protein
MFVNCGSFHICEIRVSVWTRRWSICICLQLICTETCRCLRFCKQQRETEHQRLILRDWTYDSKKPHYEKTMSSEASPVVVCYVIKIWLRFQRLKVSEQITETTAVFFFLRLAQRNTCNLPSRDNRLILARAEHLLSRFGVCCGFP